MPFSHRAWAEIDLDAFRGNALTVRNALGTACFFAVLKADAYGHGAAVLAKALTDAADGIAVATLDEAFELRASGYKGLLAVLSFADEKDFEKAVSLDILLTVFSYETATTLQAAAARVRKAARYFLAVETGMTRLGLSCDEEGVREAVRIASLPLIEPFCVFTHPACAEDPEHPANRLQKERFADFTRRTEEKGLVFPYKCLCNSAILGSGKNEGTLCKIGLLLYGLSPAGNQYSLPLRPVLSLRARILRLLDIPAGTGIGYGHTFRSCHAMKIATVAIGYADGVPTALSGRGSVLIRGKRAPIVGRICMDMMTVDITDIPGVTLLDVATLIGENGEEAIGADETAALAGTVSYDVLCSIGRRVPRVYLQNKKETETVFYLKTK